MQVYCKGTARIRHHATGEIHEIESDELDWDAVGGDERQMGSEIHYEATVEHAELGEISWGLWEYPVGIENHRETNAGFSACSARMVTLRRRSSRSLKFRRTRL
jgi:hypothetical protein